MELRITTLGGLEMKLGETAVSGFVSHKAEALFVYLACVRRPVSRMALATLLWDDLPQDRALGNLSVLLNSLRKQVEPFLVISRNEIAFQTESPHWLDVTQFENRITAVRQQLQRNTPLTRTTATQLTEAAHLYKGEFLAGFAAKEAAGFDEWLFLERERLGQLAITAVERLVSYSLERQEYRTGIEQASRLLQLDPLREEGHRQMMRLLAANNQRHAALEQFETCRRILREELGVEPDRQTVALYQEIKETGGRWQVASRETSSPTVTPPSFVPQAIHNLPAQSSPFVGREPELVQIRERLLDPGCRLLTVVGLGGVGKTRLALQAAVEQVGQFRHGVWFVPLAGIKTADFLVSAVLRALDTSPTGQTDPTTQLLDYVRQKEMLLVFDNFEHVLEGADLLTTILQTASEVKLLVTSRERLNLQAEWMMALEGLLYPADDASPALLPQYEAIQLFMHKAQQVEPNFTLTADIQPPLQRICQLVGGMPLGLELAAASVRYYGCNEIAASLAHNLDFLTATARDIPARHRSLRAVFDHSWQMLSLAEQAAFQALALFQGSFSRSAAEVVADCGVAILNSLVDKSLVWRQENGRYELHQVLRHYALEKLENTAEKEAVYGRWVHTYAHFLQQRVPQVASNRQKQALYEIGVELENIRAVWQWVCQPHQKPLLLQVVQGLESLFVFWEVRSYYAEGEQNLAHAITSLQPPATPEEQTALSNLLVRHAWMYFRLARYQEANEQMQRSLVLEPSPHAPMEKAYRPLVLGAVAFGMGQLAESRQLFWAAYEVYAENKNAWGMAGTLNNLGQIAMVVGEFQESQRLLGEAVAISRANGLSNFLEHGLHNLGALMLTMEDYGAAMACFQESLGIATELNDQSLMALNWNFLGKTAVSQQQYPQATPFFHQAYTVFNDLGDRLNMAQTLNLLGHTAWQQHHFAEAQDYLHQALKLAWEIQAVSLVLNILVDISAVFCHTHRYEQALFFLQGCQQHPACEPPTKNLAEYLLATFAANLPSIEHSLPEIELEKMVQKVLQ